MPLFVALAYVLLGKQDKASEQLKIAKSNLARDEYWRERFEQFELKSIIDNFPENKEEVQKILNSLRERYNGWTQA